MLRSTITAGTAAVAAAAAVVLEAGSALAAAWIVAPSPPVGQDAYINGIAARTDADAWAVGSVGQQTSKVPALPLIDHWNGTTWSQATPPSFPAANGVHLGWVSASSAADARAVGTINQVKHPRYFGPLTIHWDGTTWTTVSSPNVGSVSQLTSVSASPAAAIVWAAGYSGVSGSFNPLTLQKG